MGQTLCKLQKNSANYAQSIEIKIKIRPSDFINVKRSDSLGHMDKSLNSFSGITSGAVLSIHFFVEN